MMIRFRIARYLIGIVVYTLSIHRIVGFLQYGIRPPPDGRSRISAGVIEETVCGQVRCDGECLSRRQLVESSGEGREMADKKPTIVVNPGNLEWTGEIPPQRDSSAAVWGPVCAGGGERGGWVECGLFLGVVERCLLRFGRGGGCTCLGFFPGSLWVFGLPLPVSIFPCTLGVYRRRCVFLSLHSKGPVA